MQKHRQTCAACGFQSPPIFAACARCNTLLTTERAPHPPLIGQAAAASAIHTSIDRAFSVGVPTVVMLEGARGSGKTRLLLHAGEFGARAMAEVRVLFAQCARSTKASPYSPFAELLLQRFDATTDDVPDGVVRAHLARVVSDTLSTKDAVTVSETTHLLGHIAGIDFPDSPFLTPLADKPAELRRRAGLALRKFLEADSQRTPLLILVDDARAMQDEAWHLLRLLSEAEGHLAIIVAGDAGAAARARESLPADRTTIVPIAPMDDGDVAAMLYVLLPSLGTVPEALVTALQHRSGGNPSMLRTLVYGLHEHGVFVDTDGVLEVDLARIEKGDLPVTMDDAIEARLSRLNAFERITLERAAVVGERFWDGAVVAAMRWEKAPPALTGDALASWPDDDQDRNRVRETLAALTAKGFITPSTGAGLPGAQEYVFELSRMRERIHGELDENVKVQRHIAIAGWLGVTAEVRREGIAALIAPHLEEAGWMHRAGRAYFEAAVYERARLHTQTALTYIEKALPLLPEEDMVRRIDAMHEKGSLLATLGRYSEAIDAFSNMLRTSWSIGAVGKGAAALNRIGRVHRERGEDQLAEQVLERALVMFRTAGDLRGVAATLDDLAQVARLREDAATALPLAAEALELRRRNGDRRGEGVSLGTLGAIEFSRGRLDAAELYFIQALEIAQEVSDPIAVSHCHNALAALAFERGDVTGAVDAWRSALALARKIGARREQCIILNNIGEALIAQDDLTAASKCLDEADHLATALGDKRALADIVRNLGVVALRRGEAEANTLFLQALRAAEEYGGREAIAHAHRTIAQGRAKSGDPDGKAEMDFLASIDIFRMMGNEREAAKSLVELGHHLAERGDHRGAREWLLEARTLIERVGLPGLDRVNALLRTLDTDGKPDATNASV